MRDRAIPVTVSINSSLLARLDNYLEKAGKGRSSFITDLIAERLASASDITVSTIVEEKENRDNG